MYLVQKQQHFYANLKQSTKNYFTLCLNDLLPDPSHQWVLIIRQCTNPVTVMGLLHTTEASMMLPAATTVLCFLHLNSAL